MNASQRPPLISSYSRCVWFFGYHDVYETIIIHGLQEAQKKITVMNMMIKIWWLKYDDDSDENSDDELIYWQERTRGGMQLHIWGQAKVK